MTLRDQAFRAYIDGQTAQRNGLPKSSNPHKDMIIVGYWNQGWEVSADANRLAA